MNKNKEWQNASMKRFKTISSCCKNGTNKERVRWSELHLRNWRQAYADWSHIIQFETIERKMRRLHTSWCGTRTVWREDWLYTIKDTLTLQRIINTLNKKKPDERNDEGLIRWELQWQCLKFHNKRIWNLHWRREWC